MVEDTVSVERSCYLGRISTRKDGVLILLCGYGGFHEAAIS